MALARVKVWNPGDVLTAADLNAEFNNILNNPTTLISPFTANLDLGNFQLVRARLENVTTTQAAAQVGRAMFNTSDNMVNIDDGSVIRRVPTMISTAMVLGDLMVASTHTVPTWALLHNVTSSNTGAPLVSTTSAGPTYGTSRISNWICFSGATTSSQITALDAVGFSTAANGHVQVSSGVYQVTMNTPYATADFNAQAFAMQSTDLGSNRGLIVNMATSARAAGSVTVTLLDGATNQFVRSSFIAIRTEGRV